MRAPLAYSCCVQEPGQGSSPAVLKARSALVRVDASVVDKHGNFIGGLARKNFRVFDDGTMRSIRVFAPVEAPAQVLVMMEASPAVYLIHDEHLAAAYALLGGLSPDDQVALVTYDDVPHAVLGWTRNKAALLTALNRVQYTIGMGDLRFYDSLSDTLDWLGPSVGKKAVVLLTTGLDASPPSRWTALVDKLRGTDTVIYSVALGGSLRESQRWKSKARQRVCDSPAGIKPGAEVTNATAAFEKADCALIALANMTGGRAYFPASSKDFAPIYHEIASALRHQYVLGVAPAHDGEFHRLTVELIDREGKILAGPDKKSNYRVFAREGYLAPAP